jgi:hypothetical protein
MNSLSFSEPNFVNSEHIELQLNKYLWINMVKYDDDQGIMIAYVFGFNLFDKWQIGIQSFSNIWYIWTHIQTSNLKVK